MIQVRTQDGRGGTMQRFLGIADRDVHRNPADYAAAAGAQNSPQSGSIKG